MVGVGGKQLDQLREQKPYWWAALSTPVSYVSWFTATGCFIGSEARPGLPLVQIAIGVAAVAVAAAIVKAIAVEVLLNRLTNLRKPLRPDLREARRLQIYRASRRDGFIAIGRVVGTLAGKAIIS